MASLLVNRGLRAIALLVLTVSLTGCLYWIRAYQTYLQMNEFDRYFTVAVTDDFTLQFKKPILYNQDFISLSKLYPSADTPTTSGGRHWRYWFRKVDADNKPVAPEIKFYSDLLFNQEKRLTAWSFSSLFLQIAPPQFLEISLRSIAGANIDKEKKQLKANTDLLGKISAELPKKAAVLAQLGEPLEIKDEAEQEIYIYHFLLDSPRIEEGYENNALNEVKLSFDKKNHELFNMAGNFAGLKVSIDYRKFLAVPTL
ncbi:MAG: hypothetical protein Q7U57_06025 [Methylovulum sp.]|nr:hypothetical protein [Methylovulum sp.]